MWGLVGRSEPQVFLFHHLDLDWVSAFLRNRDKASVGGVEPARYESKAMGTTV